jgi:hypothetical protein
MDNFKRAKGSWTTLKGRGGATIEAIEVLASVKIAIFYIAHTQFIIVHYLEL